MAEFVSPLPLAPLTAAKEMALSTHQALSEIGLICTKHDTLILLTTAFATAAK